MLGTLLVRILSTASFEPGWSCLLPGSSIPTLVSGDCSPNSARARKPCRCCSEATLGASALLSRGLGPRFPTRSRQVRPPIDLGRDRLLSCERLENLLLSDCRPPVDLGRDRLLSFESLENLLLSDCVLSKKGMSSSSLPFPGSVIRIHHHRVHGYDITSQIKSQVFFLGLFHTFLGERDEVVENLMRQIKRS